MDDLKIKCNYESIYSFLCGYLYDSSSSSKNVQSKLSSENINYLLTLNWKANEIPIPAIKHYIDTKIIDTRLHTRFWDQYLLLLVDRGIIHSETKKYKIRDLYNKDIFYAIMIPLVQEHSGKSLYSKVDKYPDVKLFGDLYAFLGKYKVIYVSEKLLAIYAELYSQQIAGKKKIRYTLTSDRFLRFLSFA